MSSGKDEPGTAVIAAPPSRRSPLRFVAAAASYPLLFAPFWRRSWLHQMGRCLVLVLYIYVALLIALLVLEDHFLYHAALASESWTPPPAGVAVEDVALRTADGTAIHGWWSVPDGWTPERGAVLYCHGNADNLSHWGSEIPIWQARLGAGVLFFDYPGFGKSGGAVSEAGCYAAADAACDWLTQEKAIPGRRVVIVGRSLGTGPATDLASRRPCRALILFSPFTSFPDLAQEKYPMFPGRWLVHNRYDNLRKITACRCPIFIAHGTADALIPFHHGQQLFAAAAAPKRFHAMPGLNHEEPPDAAFYDDVKAFLKEAAP
ncbi:MAG TPA: alpha/beta hydrolase [Gemmataceae bacterium]|nr:alpha/beta hydrolase [Gemmataceae bacterium]